MKICFLSGSCRNHSLNTALCGLLYEIFIDKIGKEKCFLLKNGDLNIPIYNGDYEDSIGIPEDITYIYSVIDKCDAIVISSPEYNGYFSPFIKNIFDWISRINGNDLFYKKCLLSSVSPSILGGSRGLVHLKYFLSGLGFIINPYNITLSKINHNKDVKIDKITKDHMLYIDKFIKFI